MKLPLHLERFYENYTSETCLLHKIFFILQKKTEQLVCCVVVNALKALPQKF